MKRTTFNIVIAGFTAFALLLLSYRIIRTAQLHYIFLVWNLFLAFIPFWISQALRRIKKPGFIHWAATGAWLLFIPNAPYLLTDLFHLKATAGVPFWLDLVIILSFAVIGLMLFYRSLSDMISVLKTRFNPRHIDLITPFLLWLISFGLYLGRYGRFNSWDILFEPFTLARRSFYLLHHKDALGFTVIFSIFIWLVYVTFTNFNTKESSDV